jgi:hypothetical protein
MACLCAGGEKITELTHVCREQPRRRRQQPSPSPPPRNNRLLLINVLGGCVAEMNTAPRVQAESSTAQACLSLQRPQSTPENNRPRTRTSKTSQGKRSCATHHTTLFTPPTSSTNCDACRCSHLSSASWTRSKCAVVAGCSTTRCEVGDVAAAPVDRVFLLLRSAARAVMRACAPAVLRNSSNAMAGSASAQPSQAATQCCETILRLLSSLTLRTLSARRLVRCGAMRHITLCCAGRTRSRAARNFPNLQQQR